MTPGLGAGMLECFDWGIRLAVPGSANFLTPVWEARYEELIEARLVTAPSYRGVRFRVAVSDDAPVSDDVPVSDDTVIFWTRHGSEVLDRLQEHAVSVDRAVDQVPDPPPVRGRYRTPLRAG